MALQTAKAIFLHELSRSFKTFVQSVVSPFVTTSLYLVVFGAALGSMMEEVEGVQYSHFILPGLIVLTVATQSSLNTSFSIFFPK